MCAGSLTAVASRRDAARDGPRGSGSPTSRRCAIETGDRVPRPGPARAGACAKPPDLRTAKTPGASALELIEPDRADPNADESVDRRTDGAEHPPQLSFPALREDRPVPDE